MGAGERAGPAEAARRRGDEDDLAGEVEAGELVGHRRTPCKDDSVCGAIGTSAAPMALSDHEPDGPEQGKKARRRWLSKPHDFKRLCRRHSP
jgi:hypothetical protein